MTHITRDEFIDRFRHEIGGLVLDAATTQRTGVELAMSVRHVMKKIDAMLGTMYATLVPADPIANGKAHPMTPARKV